MSQKVKVLIVDDSAYMRVILKDMIALEDGLEVVGTAKDGIDALERIKQSEPDVVLLDIQMPKMDGLATLQRIMRECPTRVIMLSAMDKVLNQLKILQNQLFEYLKNCLYKNYWTCLLNTRCISS